MELFRDRKLDAQAILHASRQDRLGALLPDERLLLPLWEAMETAWSRSKTAGPKTLARYRCSTGQLLRLGPLPSVDDEGGTVVLTAVQDLIRVDWEAVAERWEASASDWMNFYRMLSRFLTLHLGGAGKFGRRTGNSHPWRLNLMDRLPRKPELKQVPRLTPATFLRLVSLTPEWVRPCYMTLVLTGLRVSEYLALQRHHLRPETFELEVPGTKTPASAAVLPVEPPA